MVFLQNIVKANECVFESSSEIKTFTILIVDYSLDFSVHSPSPTEHNLPLVKNVCRLPLQYMPILHEQYDEVVVFDHNVWLWIIITVKCQVGIVLEVLLFDRQISGNLSLGDVLGHQKGALLLQ